MDEDKSFLHKLEEEESSVSLSPLSDVSLSRTLSEMSWDQVKSPTSEDSDGRPLLVPYFTAYNVRLDHNDVDNWIQPAFFSSVGKEDEEFCDRELMRTVGEGLSQGNKPHEAELGVSGAFMMKNAQNEIAAIFKPEEALSRRSSCASSGQMNEYRKGVKYSESSVREVAAFLLDSQRFANVPETILVRVNHRGFTTESIPRATQNFGSTRPKKLPTRSHSLMISTEKTVFSKSAYNIEKLDSVQEQAQSSGTMASVWKTGSLQRYVEHDDDACDVSYSIFDCEQIHRLGVFDVRVLNTDRHEGNILVKQRINGSYKGGVDLFPIDHGLILPDFGEINAQGNFCWMYWPQSREKFSPQTKAYVRDLDSTADTNLLKRLLGSKLTLRGLFSLILGTMLLKIAVLEFDLSLRQIGEVITGEYEDKLIPSPLTKCIEEADKQTGFSDNMQNPEAFLDIFASGLRDHITKTTL